MNAENLAWRKCHAHKKSHKIWHNLRDVFFMRHFVSQLFANFVEICFVGWLFQPEALETKKTCKWRMNKRLRTNVKNIINSSLLISGWKIFSRTCFSCHLKARLIHQHQSFLSDVIQKRTNNNYHLWIVLYIKGLNHFQII